MTRLTLADLHARYDGPIPAEERARYRAQAYPPRGSRAADLQAWDSVRFWAAAARKAPDGNQRALSRYWLRLALEKWAVARRDELAATSAST